MTSYDYEHTNSIRMAARYACTVFILVLILIAFELAEYDAMLERIASTDIAE